MVDSNLFHSAAHKRAQSRVPKDQVPNQYGPTLGIRHSEEQEKILSDIESRVSKTSHLRSNPSIPHEPIGEPRDQVVSESGWNPYQKEELPQQEVQREETPKFLPPEPINKPQPIQTQNKKTSHHARMGTGEKVQFMLLRTIGNFLVLISLYGVFATFGPALTSEVKYQVAQIRGIQYVVEDTQQAVASASVEAPQQKVEPGFGDVLAGATEQVLIPPDTQFSIVIPKIGATSKIFPNVDPVIESEFTPILQQGVAHAKGTVFPGMEGNVYLFAHSTDNFWNVGRYNAIFYLIKELKPGDEIIVYFENKRFNYVVERTEIKDPTDVEFLINSQKPGSQQLIMQTCWPPGTTWKRLFVIAKPA